MILDFTQKEPEEKPLTFGDVEPGRFYLDRDGDLCIKTDKGGSIILYSNIVSSVGRAVIGDRHLRSDALIQKILPAITGIKY